MGMAAPGLERQVAGDWSALSRVRYSRLQVILRARGGGQLPRSPAALLRGCFGSALRSVSCVQDVEYQCAACDEASRAACAYLYIFDTPLPADTSRLRGVKSIPRPFVLGSPRREQEAIRPGGPLRLALTLVGRAAQHLPHVLVALGRMAARGLGLARMRFELEAISQETPEGLALVFAGNRQVNEVVEESGPPALSLKGDTAAIRYLSPTSVVSDGRVLDRVTFQALVRALLRRASSLAYFHCGVELELDFPALVDRAGGIWLESWEGRCVRDSRYSSRQGRQVPRRGVLGRGVYRGRALPGFLPLLALGTALGVGKNTTSGMGSYIVEEPGTSKQKR